MKDLGRIAGGAPLHVSIALNYRDPAGLEAFIEATADPDSPQYGHYLTPAEFEARYAPSATDYRRVTTALAAAGFTIDASPTHSLIRASAPAAAVEKFFGTEIHAVQQPGIRGTRYANAEPAYIPAQLRDVTFGVAGLNDLIVAKPTYVRGARRTDVALGPPLQGPDTGLGPYAFASAYDLPVQFSKPGGGTYDGTGHAAGIAIDSDLGAPGDLAGFLSYFGITQTGPPLKRVLVDGGPSPIVNGDSVETNLDVETISSLAPGAATYLYLMPELSTPDIVDTYSAVVADDKVDALDSSFGGCEIADNLAALSDHVATQGAAEGITFSASSGDDGASICIGYTNNFLGVSAPASAPHFTAVGGTSLIISPAGAYRLEYAWSGSGGGVSVDFPLPTYQKGIKTAISSGRNLPDISFDANPGTGAAYYYGGVFEGPIGGTSLSSPIFVAYVTERNEVAGKRSGAIDTALYSAWKKDGYGTLFRDITIGNNFLFGVTSGIPGYFAGPGYDDVTGIGSIIGTPNAK
jgi:kumamolisin